jgi:hypothetical protein
MHNELFGEAIFRAGRVKRFVDRYGCLLLTASIILIATVIVLAYILYKPRRQSSLIA